MEPPAGTVPGSGGATNTDRRMRLWRQVVDNAQGPPVGVEHVCAAVISATGVDGVAVTAVLGDGLRETVYASDAIASELAESTLTLGEGPGADAWTGGPVLVADLTSAESRARWPVFAPAAAHAGATSMFALPLRVGAVHVGVMDLYRAGPVGLVGERLADALVLADTACALLLDAAQQDRPRPDGRGPEPAGLAHPEVHQATGMVTVQLGVSAAVALIRLRAYAYAHDRRLREVAGDVVARRLRLHPDPDGGSGER